MLLVLPLVYALSYAGYLPGIDQQRGLRDHRYTLTAVAWLSAFLTSIIAFMMPVVMAPLLMGRGVTIENSADWYNQVYTPLLGWRVVPVAIGTVIGFAVVAAVLGTPHVHKRLPTK